MTPPPPPPPPPPPHTHTHLPTPSPHPQQIEASSLTPPHRLLLTAREWVTPHLIMCCHALKNKTSSHLREGVKDDLCIYSGGCIFTLVDKMAIMWNLDFQVRFDFEGQCEICTFKLDLIWRSRSTNPQNNRDLNQRVFIFWSNLVRIYHADKLRVGTHGRTHTQTHKQTQAATIPEAQNWPRVINMFLSSLGENLTICSISVSAITENEKRFTFPRVNSARHGTGVGTARWLQLQPSSAWPRPTASAFQYFRWCALTKPAASYFLRRIYSLSKEKAL